MTDIKSDAPVQWAIRIPPETATRVDARVAGTGLSRNEWLNRVIEWALEQPATTRTVQVKL